jgi:hypothetical protein
VNEETNNTLLGGLDKALLIALAAPVAYLLAFQFGVGYLGFFGIPDSLVDVSLRDLLLAAAALLSFAYVVYLGFDAFLVFLPGNWPQRIRKRAIWLFWICVALILLLRLIDASNRAWLVLVAVIALLFFFLVALPRIRGRNSPEERSPAAVPTVDPYALKGIIPTLLLRGVNRSLVFLVVMLVMISNLANVAGDGKALTQSTFAIHQSDNGEVCAIVRMRDRDLICADFDAKTNQLTGDFHFLSTETTTFRVSDTGRLKKFRLSKAPTPEDVGHAPYWLRNNE